MKSLSEKFEKMMMAITFAEAGEHETAREILKDSDRRPNDRPSVSERPRKQYRAAAPKR